MSCLTDERREPGVTTIFLARHGQSECNAERRISGQLDSPLSAQGRRQALALRQALQGETLAAIYTSSLTRSIETARPTAKFHGLPIQSQAALQEMHLGVLQGRFRDARDPEAKRLWAERKRDPWHYRVPGGEIFAELVHRVVPCLNEILTQAAGTAVLIVGHRHTNRVILGTLLHWTQERMLAATPRSHYLYAIRPGEEPSISTISLEMSGEASHYAGCKM